jgi:Plasmid replication region DNA-binding N-term
LAFSPPPNSAKMHWLQLIKLTTLFRAAVEQMPYVIICIRMNAVETRNASQARGIQYDTVAAVADKLVAAGVKADQISAIMIREETRTGSLTTIINHLRQWKIHSTKAIIPTSFSDDDLHAILMVMTSKVQEAASRVRDEERAAMATKLAEMDIMREQLQSAIQLNSQIEAERAEAADKLVIYRKKLQDMRDREERLQGELAGLNRALARFAPDLPGTTEDAVGHASNQTFDHADKSKAISPHQASVSEKLGTAVAKVVGEAVQRNGDDPQIKPF